MTLLQAIIIGIVQGLTEFIPVSSSAHLIFASRLTGLYDGVEQTLRAERTTATIAVVQLGTLVAVLIYYAPRIWSISYCFCRDHLALLSAAKRSATGATRLSDDARLGWLVILGSLPIGIVGLLFKEQIEGTFTKNLWVNATMMILIALLLGLAEKIGTQRREIKDLGVRDALGVGCAQVLALIPGASRSGSTIMGGLFIGQTRRTAADFSFLLSMPAIAASGVLELGEAIEKLPPGSLVPVVVAMITAGVVGYASIWFLLAYLNTRTTGIFIGYRLVVGVLLLALLSLGIIQPLDDQPRSRASVAVAVPVTAVTGFHPEALSSPVTTTTTAGMPLRSHPVD